MTEVTQSVTQQRLDDWWRLNRGMIPLHPGKKPKERPGYSPSRMTAIRDWNNRVELFHEYQAELRETTISPRRHALYLLTLMECGFKPQGYGDYGSVSREQYENMRVWTKKMKHVYIHWWKGDWSNEDKRFKWKYRYEAWCRVREKTHEQH